MMIDSKTKQVAVVAVVSFVGMSIVVAFGVRTILTESAKLSEQVEAIAIDQSQQTATARLQKLVKETEQDRLQLRSYYLASQADSIDFLNYIEQLAADRGVLLETLNSTQVERVNGSTYLSVGYTISGSLSQVELFIELLETIPYVSQIQSIALTQQSSVFWKADITIDVAVLTYE